MKNSRSATVGRLGSVRQWLRHGEDSIRRDAADGHSSDAFFSVYTVGAMLLATGMAMVAFAGNHGKMPNVAMHDMPRESPSYPPGGIVSVGSATHDAKPAEISPPEQSRRKPVRYVF